MLEDDPVPVRFPQSRPCPRHPGFRRTYPHDTPPRTGTTDESWEAYRTQSDVTDTGETPIPRHTRHWGLRERSGRCRSSATRSRPLSSPVFSEGEET